MTKVYLLISGCILNIWLLIVIVSCVSKFIQNECRIYKFNKRAKKLGMTPNQYAAYLHLPVNYREE